MLQYLNTPLCHHQTLPGTCPSPRDQNSPVVLRPIGPTSIELSRGWVLLVSVSAYKQAEAERKSDPICRKVGGRGICSHPGKGK